MESKMDNSDMPVPDIHPTLAEDVERSDPPPSYEEVMGQFVTSVPQSQQELPALSYIDIMPRMVDPGNMKEKMEPTFETFSDIMRGANVWLKDNPGLRVWKCETVERKVELGPTVHLDTTVHHESSYGANFYVFGVRLWLTQRLDPKDPVQQLGLLNVPPPVKEIPVTVMHRGFGMGMLGMGMPAMPVMTFRSRGRMAVLTQGSFLTYEDLPMAVASFNEAMKEQPLEGSILSVETSLVKFGDGFSKKEADPDVTSWSEKGKGSSMFSLRRFTKILRIFFVKGQPAHETLSMTTFLPKVEREPEWNRAPQFENFDCVMARLQAWLPTQTGSRVVSIETRDSEYNHGFGLPLTIQNNSTDNVMTSLVDRKMVRYLRAFTVTSSSSSSRSYASSILTSRLFVPLRLQGRQFESMTQTMFRINAWLALVGQPIFSVETVPFLLMGSSQVDQHRNHYKHSPRVGNYWLTCVRLYFHAPFQEPPQNLLPPPSHFSGKEGSSSCSIL